MTRYEMRKRAERAECLAWAFGLVLAFVLVFGAFVVGVKVGEQKGAEVGAEQLRKAQAQAYDEGAEFGNGEGWRECIEENNLYDRYVREGSRDTSRE